MSCLLCRDKCRGHSLGHESQWVPQDGSVIWALLGDPCDDWSGWPDMPDGDTVWYKGWECGWDDDASRYGLEPWSAYKGGADLDAPHLTGKTWFALLMEIDEYE